MASVRLDRWLPRWIRRIELRYLSTFFLFTFILTRHPSLFLPFLIFLLFFSLFINACHLFFICNHLTTNDDIAWWTITTTKQQTGDVPTDPICLTAVTGCVCPCQRVVIPSPNVPTEPTNIYARVYTLTHTQILVIYILARIHRVVHFFSNFQTTFSRPKESLTDSASHYH